MKPLLGEVSWDDIEALNQFLCISSGYQIGRTSDGYERAKQDWERGKEQSFTVGDIAKLCHRCHRLAPFLFLNGNTFVAIARDAIIPALAHLSVANQSIIRGTIGHFIAGTIGLEEMNLALQAIFNSGSAD